MNGREAYFEPVLEGLHFVGEYSIVAQGRVPLVLDPLQHGLGRQRHVLRLGALAKDVSSSRLQLLPHLLVHFIILVPFVGEHLHIRLYLNANKFTNCSVDI